MRKKKKVLLSHQICLFLEIIHVFFLLLNAVKWYWQSDNGWELYQIKTLKKLEAAFQKDPNNEEVQIDDEVLKKKKERKTSHPLS
jgi:hypothetical protein